MMKQSMMLTRVLILFGAGVLAGYYGTVTLAEPGSPGVPPLPDESMFTAETRAQLIAQQREAMRAQTERLGEIIQSMRENGLPNEDIQAFMEIKRAMEAQQISEPEPSMTNRSEPSIEEIRNNFDASFERAGIPPAERARMIIDLLSSLESTNENEGEAPLPPPEESMR